MNKKLSSKLCKIWSRNLNVVDPPNCIIGSLQTFHFDIYNILIVPGEGVLPPGVQKPAGTIWN